MVERPARQKRQTHHARVVRRQQLTPQMVRLVLGGDGLTAFTPAEYTDHYIKLLFPVEGVDYPEPFDIAQIRADLPRDQWPRMRTYTVRNWDPEALELSVDFVIHGADGLAGPWAAGAQPGDEIRFLGPGGGYAPDSAADWHLLAGDESALPAIAVALERLHGGSTARPADAAQVRVLLEVTGAEEEQPLTVPDGVVVQWLHRGDAPAGSKLVPAVRALEFPAGQPHAFVHGEAGFVKELRRYLRVEREIPRERLSISGYWRDGHDEDGWQASKSAWNQQVEAEQEKALVSSG
ncbi:siderophore-interacting protein [Streptomyces sp. TP-A0874]|uniref:siderophore-interacting protein n=1 Tax=Streptomyces sp. TP-A0874 TaxID=549819 RepID=UPI0008536C42|nr:siderophore-interacting protein [Streptomyces sp. TP-A0874]